MTKGRSRMFGEFLSRIASGVDDEVRKKLELSDEEDAQITQAAIARATAPRKIKELQDQIKELQDHAREAPTSIRKGAPKGFERLGRKKNDLSKYLDRTKLTNIQRDCFSLKFEYALPLAEIARRLDKHHSTVQYHIARVTKKIEHNRAYEGRAKKRASAGAE